MNRRSFLASILAAGVAPAVVGSGILMPVRQILLPIYEEVPLVQTIEDFVVGKRGGCTLLTPTIITREALIILEENLRSVVLGPHPPIRRTFS